MTDQTSGSGLPLETLVASIKAHNDCGVRDARRSEDHFKAAGIMLIEAKARIGVELPGTRWLDWATNNFRDIGSRRIQQLMQIGRGEITQASLNEANAKGNRERRAAARNAPRGADSAAGPARAHDMLAVARQLAKTYTASDFQLLIGFMSEIASDRLAA